MNMGRQITLRMGADEVQSMDSYLSEHPELGSQSMFIRTAVREYINRDADVAVSDSDGILVRFTEAEMMAIDAVVKSGDAFDAADCVRLKIREFLRPQNADRSIANDAYRLATSDLVTK